MLNIRETDQQTVWKFCKDPQGLALVAENLRLNQMLMEEVIRPRLIMVKNRGSWCFWGKEATADENIWMGYRFEPVEGFDNLPCGELLRITGLIDHPARIARHQLPATHLQGTFVLFTSHFSRRTPETLPTPELLEKLCKMI